MSLKFLLDENVPYSTYRYLKSRGFKVSYVPSGIRNKEVAELAKKTGAVLVTRDWDFSNVMLYPPEKYNGIIILKIHPPLGKDLIRALENFLSVVKDLNGRTFIIYRDRIEIVE